jgi:hypothetical protein
MAHNQGKEIVSEWLVRQPGRLVCMFPEKMGSHAAAVIPRVRRYPV